MRTDARARRLKRRSEAAVHGFAAAVAGEIPQACDSRASSHHITISLLARSDCHRQRNNIGYAGDIGCDGPWDVQTTKVMSLIRPMAFFSISFTVCIQPGSRHRHTTFQTCSTFKLSPVCGDLESNSQFSATPITVAREQGAEKGRK